MKFSIYTILFFLSYGRAIAQCGFKDYEDFISKNCIDCNQSQVNIFLYKKCSEADSLLLQTKRRIHNKITGHFNGSKTEKQKMEETYNKSFDALIEARHLVFRNYDSLTSPGDNGHYTQLFYWYYTDKANEILKDMELTIFGD